MDTTPAVVCGDGVCSSDSEWLFSCAQDCGGRCGDGDCTSAVDPTACANRCLQFATGLGATCTSCLAEVATCSTDLCATECINASTNECLACHESICPLFSVCLDTP